jgi:hypothetical protein
MLIPTRRQSPIGPRPPTQNMPTSRDKGDLRLLEPPVHVLAVAYCDHEDGEDLLLDSVDYPVAADPYAKQVRVSLQGFRFRRSRLGSQIDLP